MPQGALGDQQLRCPRPAHRTLCARRSASVSVFSRVLPAAGSGPGADKYFNTHSLANTSIRKDDADLAPFVCQWDPVDSLCLSGLLALHTGQCLAGQAVWQGHTLPALLLQASI